MSDGGAKCTKNLYELEHGLTGLLAGSKTETSKQVTFQGCEDALTQNIALSIPHLSHRKANPSFRAALAEGDRCVLAVFIEVVDDPVWSLLPDCHFESVHDQLGAIDA